MPPRLRPDIATADTDDGLVLLDERSGRYWQLNLTGADILRAVLHGENPEDIARGLSTRHHVELPQASADVSDIIEQLHTANLLVRE